VEFLSVLTLDRLGLVLNLAGTILVAFSVGRNPGEAYQDVGSREAYQYVGSRRRYLASVVHPSWFHSGLGLLGVGFFFQLFG
jgi:hypothetical protein